MSHPTGSPAGTPPTGTRFTAAQEAAIAKLSYAAEHAAAVALLCGPAGVGKTTILRHVAAKGMPSVRHVRLCDGRDACAQPPVAADAAVELLLVDEADRVAAAELVMLVESWRRVRPGIVIVLGGQGRLLSLCGCDRRLEQMVRLRITLPPFTLDETRDLLQPLLPIPHASGVLETIHEISAGSPAVALRMADIAGVLAAGDPLRRLLPDDVEAIHRRLCVHAA